MSVSDVCAGGDSAILGRRLSIVVGPTYLFRESQLLFVYVELYSSTQKLAKSDIISVVTVQKLKAAHPPPPIKKEPNLTLSNVASGIDGKFADGPRDLNVCGFEATSDRPIPLI